MRMHCLALIFEHEVRHYFLLLAPLWLCQLDSLTVERVAAAIALIRRGGRVSGFHMYDMQYSQLLDLV